MEIKKFESYINDEYFRNSMLKIIKDRNLELVNGKYLKLYHGTSPANYNKILKSGKFKQGTWFSPDSEVSNKFAHMATPKGRPVVAMVYIDIDSLITSGEYFIANKDVHQVFGSGSLFYEGKVNESISITDNKRIKMKMILSNDIIEIYKLFKNANKELYVVGGAVRDFINGKEAHDIDLVTDALPEESKRILSGWNVSDEQGKNFGVLRIYTEECPLGYELAVFRKDVSKGRDTKGEDKKVEFGKNVTIKDDVLRRDFTQNALFYDIDKEEIVDMVGGFDDIKNNIIRAVGNPVDRFNEDKLRILRAFRFTARSHSTLDLNTAKAIRNDNRLKGISDKDDVSQERIVEEVGKMSEYCVQKNDLKAWKDYLEMLSDFDMWEQMFPNVKTSKKVQNNDTTNLTITYTFLFDENNPTFEFQSEMIHKLKIPSKIANGVIFLLNYSIYAGGIDSIYSLKKMHNRYKTSIDDETIKEFSELIDVDNKFTDAFIKYNFTVNGNDVMKDGFKGSELGDEIQRREKEIFTDPLNEKFDF